MENVIRTGRWWFQWRGISPLPLVFVCAALPATWLVSGPQLVLILVGIALAESVRIWAVGYAGSATRTRGDTVPRLIHAGPFRYVRNPLYLANIAIYTLCGVAFGLGAWSVLVTLYFAIQYSFIVAFEEDTLQREFGVAYDFYRARVPRWVPAFAPQVEDSRHPFELLKSIRSERATFVALAFMAFLFFVKSASL